VSPYLLNEESRPSILVKKKGPVETLFGFLEPTVCRGLPGTYLKRFGARIVLFKFLEASVLGE
jgi:hypothetical protein